MDLIMDGLLLAAASFAGTYCFVLARRVRALRDLDSGIGAAIMRMTHALEDARRALEEAKAAGHQGNRDLSVLVRRAEAACGQLRMLLAATRDLPPTHDAPPVSARAHAAAPLEEVRAPSSIPPFRPARRESPLLEDRAPADPFALNDRGRGPAPAEPRHRAADLQAGRRRIRPSPHEDELIAALCELAAPRRA